jgi:hypothetical protein
MLRLGYLLIGRPLSKRHIEHDLSQFDNALKIKLHERVMQT